VGCLPAGRISKTGGAGEPPYGPPASPVKGDLFMVESTKSTPQTKITRVHRKLLGRGTTKGHVWRRNLWGLAFVLPAILFFATFSLYPVANAFYISFHKFDLFNPMQFVGLKNYIFLINSASFWNSFWVTLYYVFGTCIPIWFLSFGLALLFNRAFRLRDSFITIYFTPMVMSLVASSIIWKTMYNQAGPINTIFGLNIAWLTDSDWAMPALIILSVWKGTGYYMILYLAGLRNIPREYYEAAAIDGANPWQTLFFITLPLMKRTIVFVIIVSIVIGFKVFVPMFVMTQGGPSDATLVLTLKIYEDGFRFSRMGRATAESVFMFIFLMGFSIAQLRLFRSEE
jgi:ABC-type sugar transport system permease subunit